jgi:hypothetical protein
MSLYSHCFADSAQALYTGCTYVQYLMWAEGIFDFDFSLLNSGTACMGSF